MEAEMFATSQVTAWRLPFLSVGRLEIPEEGSAQYGIVYFPPTPNIFFS
jgi:hypothetical protein